MRVAMIADARIVIALDVGASHAVVAIVDLNGRMLSEQRRDVDAETAPAVILTWVLESVHDMLGRKGWLLERVAAVGVGLAAPIEHATGLPINPPIMPLWDGFDTTGWFDQHINAPVLVEKDVNLMALGERVLRCPKEKNLLFAKVSTGVGAGLILNGQLYRGEQGTAGDIGHVRLSRGDETPCHCGNHGCLEAIASGPSLVAALQRDGYALDNGADFLELVKAGNLDAVQALRQAGRDLGEVLASTVSLLNPSVIIIGGYLATVGEHLIAGVKEVVFARAMPLATKGLTIIAATPGSRAAVIGAGVLAIDHAMTAG